jgi:hypothetical protein
MGLRFGIGFPGNYEPLLSDLEIAIGQNAVYRVLPVLEFKIDEVGFPVACFV